MASFSWEGTHLTLTFIQYFREKIVPLLAVEIRAEELEVLVTGTPDLDFDELAKATEYDGGYGKDHPTILAFWAAVEDMPAEEQRRLLMFVTGSKKVRSKL